MAEVAKGIVDIEINTGAASAQLKALQQQISAFNLAVNKNNSFQTKAINEYTTLLKDVINSSKFFTAETVKMKTAAGALDATLRKGRGTLGQFFSARFNKNSAMFAETMALASERARSMQTQFIATSGASKGMQEALAIRPLAAFNSEMAIAAQKSQILTSMFRQGTTQLVNFGKNVQWAGRQLMVGFTLPLTVFGTTAGKVFMDLERQAVNFRKVYGDLFTPPGELEQNLEAVTKLAQEYTKYGIAVKDTIGLAAEAAAAGRTNQELIDATTQATRLSTLGQMDQAQALETTIALQSAFRLNGEDLANTINFLNMVENQTVVTLQDLAAAIPRVAPVIKGLGGDVQDMAVFLAAMQEGGVSAEQGANALKSGLASLINPTKQAKDMLADFNINLDAIIQKNRGDLMGTVTDFARVLQTLDEFSRQQVLEQVFGKFQYARLGALFENIIRDGSQANQVLKTTAFSAEELARSAEKELGAIEQSVGVQLTGAMERFKLAIAPIGEMFANMAIPIINFVTKIIEAFNNLPDFQKKFILMATVITGLVIPAGTMFFGLLMNLSGQLLKLMQSLGIFAKGMISKGGIVGGIQAVTQSMKYMSLEEIDAAIAARQLGSATQYTNQAFRDQVLAANTARVAIDDLASVYNHLINQMSTAASLSKVTLGTPRAAMTIASRNIKGATPRQKFARGGFVPGTGNTDTVPAMLTPGEFVVTKKATQSVGKGFLEKLNKGGVAGFNGGGDSALSIIEAQRKEFQNRVSGGVQNPISQNQIISLPTFSGAAIREEDLQRSFNARAFDAHRRFDPRKLELLGSNVMLLPDDVNGALRRKGGGLDSIKRKELAQYLRNTWPHSSAPLLQAIKDSGVEVSDQEVKRIMSNVAAKIERSTQKVIYDRDISKMVNAEIAKVPKLIPLVKKLRSEVGAYRIHSSGENFVNTLNAAEPGRYSLSEEKVYSKSSGKVDAKRFKVYDKVLKRTFVAGSGDTRNISKNIQKTLYGTTAKPYQALSKIPFIAAAKSAIFSSTGKKTQISHFNKGGSVPSLLTPGEFVVNREAAAANRPFLDALNAGKVKGFQEGSPATRNQRYQSIYGRSVASARVSSGLGSLSGAAGAAALPALIAGPLLQQSSNELAQKIGAFTTSLTPALFAFQLLGPLLKGLVTKLPLLAGPIGIAITAFAGIGVGLALLAKKIDEIRHSGEKLSSAFTGSADKVNAIAEQLGVETLRQKRIRAVAETAAGVSEESQAAASQFLSGEAGQQLLEDVKQAEAAGLDATAALRNQLNRLVVAGVVTPEDAKGIAVEIGTALNNQSLAINASSQIIELYDSEGNLITGNLLKLQAEITATTDRQSMEELYDSQANAFMRFRDTITGGETRQIAIDNMLIEQTSADVANSLSLAADSVEHLRTAYATGSITIDQYRRDTAKLRETTKSTVSEGLEKLGVTFEDLQKKAGDKSLFDFKGTFSQLSETEKEALEVIKNTSNNAKNILQDVLGKDASAGLMQYIKEDLTGGDVQAASEVFSQIVAGDIEPSTLNALVAAIDDPELRQKLRDLFNIPLTIGGVEQFGNYFEGTKKGLEGATDATEDYSVQVEDTTVKEKSRIQTLEESLALTKQQTLATQYLVSRGLKPEALASLDAATAVDIMTQKRTDLIKKLNDQATAQRLIAVLGKSAEDREIDKLDLESRVIDQRIDGLQKQIDGVERLNELDQRQVSVRQKALDDISKKEDALNKQYDDRFAALDKVAQVNERLAQQERNRISLASALSSGDIGAAAFAASEMTRSFAASQAEDARASLEYMQEQELANITANVNGQFLTREQIQAQIDGINERIYQRQLSTIPLEDQIYAYNQEKERIANRIEQIQINMQAKQLEEEKALARQLGLLKGKKQHAKELRDYYRDAAHFMSILYGGAKPKQEMYGGKIQKRAFGGLLKYTSNEPAPGMAMGGKVKNFAFGNIVPGMGNIDRVPALLTPGEFVVRKSVAQANMPLLQALNSDVFPTMSGGVTPSVDPGSVVSTSVVTNNTPVYNYSISVNVPNTNASPEEIANVVASRLNRINSTSIRGGRRIG